MKDNAGQENLDLCKQAITAEATPITTPNESQPPEKTMQTDLPGIYPQGRVSTLEEAVSVGVTDWVSGPGGGNVAYMRGTHVYNLTDNQISVLSGTPLEGANDLEVILSKSYSTETKL